MKRYGSGRLRKTAVDDLHLSFTRARSRASSATTAPQDDDLSVLTGLYPPTKGDCYVFGAVRRARAAAYRMLGICPQHDVLWHTLTGRSTSPSMRRQGRAAAGRPPRWRDDEDVGLPRSTARAPWPSQAA